ncbi:glycosyltransferase [Novosphingobium sp. FGD1]|uniref:Glycosyltransferase n=1 Tax=Novosphingobium silvae TaxID=2692619 RepID=A0A7X4GMA0_9SPHN|nr:glycosyltransferase family 2 protein [Novosphingobium silvae]MYM00275.1 glycosyltransferase [Novosphingobium silvae]
MTTPLVSILMVARNAAAYIDAAIQSAREQSISDLEIIVVDDGSVDATANIARDHARRDARVRVIPGPVRGLSAVRNASLAEARGQFAAILDSDDILHPRHLEWLIAPHPVGPVEIRAANMVEFEAAAEGFDARAFARGSAWEQARMITTKEFVERGMIGNRDVSLGYLKPLLDLGFLRQNGIRYDERLRIGEDFDLILRAMLAGARYLYMPQASYYYRKHSSSTSHRLSRADLEGLLHATCDYRGGDQGDVLTLLQNRRDNLAGALMHVEAIDAIKKGRLLHAVRHMATDRTARRLTIASLQEAWLKRLSKTRSVGARPASASLQQNEALPDRLCRISQSLTSATSR